MKHNNYMGLLIILIYPVIFGILIFFASIFHQFSKKKNYK